MFKNLSVLYAEDEDFLRENIKEALEFMLIDVVAVSNGEEAYEKYLELKPDIIIADIEMPILNGLKLVEKIRRDDKHTQIIITTAYEDTSYLIKAVELHLVKYLLKPLNIIELKNALQICVENLKDFNNLRYLTETSYYDMSKRILIVKNNEVDLDFNEIKFLELLLKFPNQVVPYEQIENVIWEEGMDITNLRTLVKRLRDKLPKESIQNISKVGYKVVEYIKQ